MVNHIKCPPIAIRDSLNVLQEEIVGVEVEANMVSQW